MEWRTTYTKEKQRQTALIQMYFHDEIYLFHIYAFYNKVLPIELIEILCDPNIIKVGLNINGDITKLERDFPLQLEGKIKGVVDLRNISTACEFIWNNNKSSTCNISWPNGSLDVMIEKLSIFIHLELNPIPLSQVKIQNYIKYILPKPNDIRCGNWESVPLSDIQCEYAALDAYASYLVYKTLSHLYIYYYQCGQSSDSIVTKPTAFPIFTMEGRNRAISVTLDDNSIGSKLVSELLIEYNDIVLNTLKSSKYGLQRIQQIDNNNNEIEEANPVEAIQTKITLDTAPSESLNAPKDLPSDIEDTEEDLSYRFDDIGSFDKC